MIQKLVDHFGYNTVEDVNRIEEAIGEALPSNVRGQKKVFDWLINYLSEN